MQIAALQGRASGACFGMCRTGVDGKEHFSTQLQTPKHRLPCSYSRDPPITWGHSHRGLRAQCRPKGTRSSLWVKPQPPGAGVKLLPHRASRKPRNSPEMELTQHTLEEDSNSP